MCEFFLLLNKIQQTIIMLEEIFKHNAIE